MLDNTLSRLLARVIIVGLLCQYTVSVPGDARSYPFMKVIPTKDSIHVWHSEGIPIVRDVSRREHRNEENIPIHTAVKTKYFYQTIRNDQEASAKHIKEAIAALQAAAEENFKKQYAGYHLVVDEETQLASSSLRPAPAEENPVKGSPGDSGHVVEDETRPGSSSSRPAPEHWQNFQHFTHLEVPNPDVARVIRRACITELQKSPRTKTERFKITMKSLADAVGDQKLKLKSHVTGRQA